MDWTTSLRALGSLVLLMGILALFSDNRKRIPWLLVAKGLLIQFVFAFLILRINVVTQGFQAVGQVFVNILGYTREGSLFLFGSLISDTDSFGYIFAFQVLPTVIFFSAFTSLMYYWGILQKVVWVFAWVMRWTLKVSGAESLAAAGNIFLGQTEAPLLVKPYIGKMTKSELLSLMTGGMATIAGGVLAAYIGYLGGDSEASRLFFAKHLLAASVMSAPAAIVAAKILVPETETFNQEMHISRESNGDHWLDALSRGTSDGLKLAVNVGAMLLVFTAFIYLVNSILADGIGAYTGLNAWMADFSGGRYTSFNMQAILGLSLAPLTWLMGVNWDDAALVGQLLGEKTILNEFYAYVTLGNLIETGALTNVKSQVMATYILCGFANFASIGIQIGGIGTLAPHRRADLSRLGVKALVGGTVASLFTAVLVGLFY